MRSIYLWVILFSTTLLTRCRLVDGSVEVTKPDQRTTATAAITDDTTKQSDSTTTTAQQTTTPDTESTTEESIESLQINARDTSLKEYVMDEASSASTSATTTTSSQKETTQVDETHLDVIQLNSRNFGKHISDGSIWLIEFYSPHCSHCVEFATSYADIARHYHSQSTAGSVTNQNNNYRNNKSKAKNKTKERNIRVGKVNGEIERALVSRFALHAYPCFYLVDGYSVYKFEGARSKKNLMAYVEGGYKKSVSISFYESPMGPIGIFKGTLMSTGHIFSDLFHWLQDTFSLSPLIVGIILFGAMFLGCFSLIVSLALIIPEKPKRE